MSSLVALESISRVYRRPGGDVHALGGVSLEIAEGELVCITGTSGSGKSTLLHLLGLLDTPSAGRYRLCGEDVSNLDDTERTRRRNRDISFVFQSFHLISYLSIVENVELPLVYRGLEAPERRAKAREALESVGLVQRMGHRPSELSGGEQQRAAVARALITKPRLLLADEPTGNLDDATTEAVLSLFRLARAAGAAVVIVTHNPKVAAQGDREYALRAGRLVDPGSMVDAG